MNTVTFDSKEYVKATDVAKRFKYTTDYIGQLCRAEKVDARLVGRAWYVNVDSLRDHRKGRYKKVESTAAVNTPDVPKKPENHYLSRVQVEPILNKKIVKILQKTQHGLRETPVRYEPDEYALIPRVAKDAVSRSLPVNPAGAKNLPIRGAKTTDTLLKPEPVPEVYLKGSLTISEAEDRPEEVQNEVAETVPDEVKKKESKSTRDNLQNSVVKQSHNVSVKPSKLTVTVRKGARNQPVSIHRESAPQRPAVAVRKSDGVKPRPVPTQIRRKRPVLTMAPHQKPKPPAVKRKVSREVKVVGLSRGISSIQIFAALILALGCSVLLATTSVEISVADDASTTSRLVVQLANLQALFLH